MTVAELIVKLRTMPQDAPVVHRQGNYDELLEVERVEKCWIDPNDRDYWNNSEERPGTRLAIDISN